MKKTIFLSIIVSAAFLFGCRETQKIDSVESKFGQSNTEFLKETISLLTQFDFDSAMRDTIQNIDIGKKVGLYKELLQLFDSDNFDCGCDEKLKRKLKKYRPSNLEEDESGFIPRVVINNAFITDSVLLLDRSGSSILAHGLQYTKSTGDESKLLFARNSPTVNTFNVSDYIEDNPDTYDHFLYTLDCSGFLSAAVSATVGVNKNSIRASANAVSKTDKSLIVVGGVMYSPLYQAYSGEGEFTSNDSVSKQKRIKVLEAILSTIPEQDQQDNTQIIISTNYQVIITSNSGTSSFNGEAKLGVTGGIGFGIGSVSGEGNAEGNVQRKSSFTRYKTYLIERNVGAEPNDITVKSLKEKIDILKNE